MSPTIAVLNSAAAKRIGIPLAEYISNVDAGLKWCGWKRHWARPSMFPPDASRGSGLSPWCFDCKNEKRKVTPKRRRDRYKDPKIPRAGMAVQRAIASGRLPHPSSIPCVKCGDIGKVHDYHHHKGYEPEHVTDVIAVCKRCHVAEDRKGHGLNTYTPPIGEEEESE